MPADEFIYWQSFFSIYPFTQDQQDWHNAMLLSTLVNLHNAAHASKRHRYVPVSPLEFLPDYLGEREPKVKEKSIEEQNAEFEAFKASYLAAESKARGQS